MHKMMKYRVPSGSKKGRTFSYMMFFYCFAMALIAPVLPNYFKNITGSEEYVGFLFSITALVAMLSGFVVSRVLHKISRFRLLYSGILGMAMVFLVYYFARWSGILILAQILKGFSVASLFVVIPLMVRDYTDEKSLSQEEGIYYWYINLAWILGPLTGGVLTYLLWDNAVFLFSAAVMFFAVWFLGHKNIIDVSRIKNEERSSLVKNFKRFFSNIYFLKAYLVDLGLNVWWSVATMVVPLYLVANGFSELFVGFVMGAKLIPLLLLEKRVGNHVKDGFLGINIRRGFAIMVTAMAALAIVDNVYFSIAMFFCVSTGAAFIEPVKETYLFKHMRKDQEDELFPIYSTARQVGFLIGPVTAGFAIVELGYTGLYLLMACSLLPMVLIGHLIYKE
ncbi:MAG: hypothetical protein ACD_13C00118G0002 [uncultured bacterium]|nr:MAG: hypothetical protein ACD_13C00118G0002 [uncultured bacterium]